MGKNFKHWFLGSVSGALSISWVSFIYSPTIWQFHESISVDKSMGIRESRICSLVSVAISQNIDIESGSEIFLFHRSSRIHLGNILLLTAYLFF